MQQPYELSLLFVGVCKLEPPWVPWVYSVHCFPKLESGCPCSSHCGRAVWCYLGHHWTRCASGWVEQDKGKGKWLAIWCLVFLSLLVDFIGSWSRLFTHLNTYLFDFICLFICFWLDHKLFQLSLLSRCCITSLYFLVSFLQVVRIYTDLFQDPTLDNLLSSCQSLDTR